MRAVRGLGLQKRRAEIDQAVVVAHAIGVVDALEEQDDVQNVYGNFDVPDEEEDE